MDGAKAAAGHGASSLAAAGAVDAGSRQGSSDLAVRSLQPSASQDQQQDPVQLLPSLEPPRQKGRALQACGEVVSYLQVISPIQSSPIHLEAISAQLPGLP